MSFLLCGLTSCAEMACCSLTRLCCCALRASKRGGGQRGISVKAGKAAYLTIITASAIFALILYNTGDQVSWLNNIPTISTFCQASGSTSNQCVGASAVLRISLALLIFICSQFFLAFAADSFVGCWGIKIMLWLACVIGCFFVPSDALPKYAQVARACSIAFMLAMVIILIDFAYHMQELLGDKIDATQARLEQSYEVVGCCQNGWKWLYLSIAGGSFLAAMVGIGILYHFSANPPAGASCGSNLAFLSVTLVSGIVFMVVSPLGCMGGRGGLLTPSLIFLYSTWLCWSAIYSNPNAQCSPVPPSSQNTGANIVGMIIAAGTLTYTAFSASRSLPHLLDTSAKPHKQLPTAEEAESLTANAHGAGGITPTASAVAPSPSGSSPARGAGKDALAVVPLGTDPHAASDRDEEAGTPAAYSGTGDVDVNPPYSVLNSLIFLGVLALAAMYMAPVLTNWVTDPSDVTASRSNPATMWVNIGTQWATLVLYTWTMLAPKLCPHRDFS